MQSSDFLNQLDTRVLTILVILTLIDLILRGIAMWGAANHKQKGWFVVLLLVNTLGILPALYLIYFQPPTEEEREELAKD